VSNSLLPSSSTSKSSTTASVATPP
jgi:hypothetical protein